MTRHIISPSLGPNGKTHTITVQGDRRPRCSLCEDVATTEPNEDGTMLIARNRAGKIVNRSAIRTEPGRVPFNIPWVIEVSLPSPFTDNHRGRR